MITFLKFIVPIFCVAAAFSLLLKRRIEETIPVAFLSLVVVVYATGLVFPLKVGVYAFNIIAPASIAFALIKHRQDIREIIPSRLLTPGLFVFVALSGLLVLATRNQLFSKWDEFSHWGLVIKNMYIFNTFGNTEVATTLFKGYPPANSILGYYYSQGAGDFSDANAIRGVAIFLMSLLMPILRKTKWSEPADVFVKTAIILLLPVAFNMRALTNIYVDTTMGVLMAFCVTIYLWEGYTKFSVISISLALFSLTLTKASGFGMAVLVLAIIFADLVRQLVLKKVPDLKDDAASQGRHPTIKKSIYGFCTITVAALVAKYSWSSFLILSKTPNPWPTDGLSSTSLLTFISGHGEPYQLRTLRAFLAKCLKGDMGSGIVHLPVIGWAILLLALLWTYTIIIKAKGARGRSLPSGNQISMTKTILIASIVGFFAYVGSLFFLYIFTFSAYEAEKLASIGRYLGTYLTFLLILFTSVYLNLPRELLRMSAIFVLAALLIFSSPFAVARDTVLSSRYIPARNKVQKSCWGIKDGIRDIEQGFESAKIYYIYQGNRGRKYYISKYVATPYKVSGRWSLGKPYSEDDVTTENISVKQWSDRLIAEGYTHVYVHYADERFIQQYGSLFNQVTDIRDEQMYSVGNLNGGAQLTLLSK